MITRRQLVHASSAAAAAALLPGTARARRRRRSPNEEIRVAVVGVRGRGGNHIDGFQRLENVRVVALCDPDSNELARRVAEFGTKAETDPNFAKAPDTVKDLRTLLDRDDIDVISIASPNHQHSLQAIWACQAGKDVYCEKPVSHNLWEGGQLVKAARKYDRIVQAGMQGRSSTAIQEALAWARAGNLGKMTLAHGLCYKPRRSIGKVGAPTPIPEHIDYDLWCGPAPNAPLMRANLHYDWHWQFVTGNGDLGNQGIHQMDIARWAIGADALPARATSLGGRFGYDDDGDTANTQLAWFDYEPVPLLFEVRGLPRDKAAQVENWGGGMDQYHGLSIGTVVHCADGYVAIGSNYGVVTAHDAEGAEVMRWNGNGDHFANFIEAVRSRKREDQNADIREGHLSSALCHMGNDSYKLGVGKLAAEVREGMGDAPPAAKDAFDRFSAHLEANGVDLAKAELSVGSWVELDPETEQYTGDAARLARRDYRAPFVVPEEV